MIGPASELNLDESHADNVIAANKMAVFNSRESDSFMSSAMDFRKLMALVGTFYWFVVTIIVVPTACVTTLFIFLYPILLFSRDVFNRLEHALCRMVNDHWVSTGQFSGLNVTEYGEEIRQYADKRVLFICNHLGLVDHFCLMTAFHDKASLSGRVCDVF
jgi:1-acyl-sn-glycerol-3-phosphate acyltransferase